MKRVLSIAIALIGITILPATASVQVKEAVTRGDIKVLEATENIRLLSQQIIKEYLYLFHVPYNTYDTQRLKRMLVDLNGDLITITDTTKDQDTKDILDFLSYSKDQIAKIFTEKMTKEEAALMLDYSETLLEGADSIAAAHTYPFTKEEKMLITTKQMEYLIERIMKYYIALHMGFDDMTNKAQMQTAITAFEERLKRLSDYGYPSEIKMIRRQISDAWYTNKAYFMSTDSLFIPELLNRSTKAMERLISRLSLYHNQNL